MNFLLFNQFLPSGKMIQVYASDTACLRQSLRVCERVCVCARAYTCVMYLYPPGLTILFHLEAEQLHTALMRSGLLKLTNGGKEAAHQDHEALTNLSPLFPPEGTDQLIRVTGLPAPA